MRPLLAAAFTACSVAVLGCGSLPSSKECTLIGCEQSAKIDFSFRDPGDYVFEVTVDGAKTTCRATLPLPQAPPQACDRTDVLLTLVGSALPANEQSIGGLTLHTSTAKTVVIRATRDGAVIGEKTIDLAWTVRPGPNGPDCEPKECRSATATFP